MTIFWSRMVMILVLLAIAGGLAGCATPVVSGEVTTTIAQNTPGNPTSTPLTCPTATADPSSALLTCPTPPADPAFSGTWISDQGDVLILSAEQFYLRYANDELNPGSVREIWANVVEYDETAETMTIRYTRIAINGKNGGFDSPTHRVKFEVVETEIMRLGISPLEDEIPADLQMTEYLKKG